MQALASSPTAHKAERHKPPEWAEHYLILPTHPGRPRDNMAARVKLRRIYMRLELPILRFHNLRHLSATFLLKPGIHPRIIQERLRHSSIQMTMDRYSHVKTGLDREAAAAFAKIFPGYSGHPPDNAAKTETPSTKFP